MSKFRTTGIISIIIIFIFIWLIFSFSRQIDRLSDQVAILENKFSSTTEEIKDNIQKNQAIISDELNEQRNDIDNIEKKLGVYKKEVGDFTETVSTLQKLSKTDPELLQKYSKVFFLNENYAPARLIEVPDKYNYSNTKTLKLHEQVWPYLKKMIDSANKSDTTIYVYSAYRSFTEQQALKQDYKVTYGAGTANQFSADQGYSEHQLGTTVDLIAPGLGGELSGFEKTQAYTWLIDNAHRYGFILSYAKDNKFYIYEPWHWRYVGIKLATYLHDQKKNFYDLDQREIDEYLVSFFD